MQNQEDAIKNQDDVPIHGKEIPDDQKQVFENSNDQQLYGVPLQKTTFNVSEFAEEQKEEKNQEDNLPLNKRIVSKNWKTRQKAYEDLFILFDQNSFSDQIFSEYKGQLHKLIVETNPVAQEKAVQVLLKYLQKCTAKLKNEEFAFKDIIKKLLEKTISTGKANLKKVGLESIVELFDKSEDGVIVLDNLLEFLGSKVQQKLVQAAITSILELLENFGAKKMNFLKAFLPAIEKLAQSTNASIRADSMNFFKESYKWLGKPIVETYISSLKKAQIEELEKFFEENPRKNMKPLRSEIQQVNNPLNLKTGKQEVVEQTEDIVEDMSPYMMADPVDVFSKQFSESWCSSLLAKSKWSEKKQQMDEFISSIDNTPKLNPQNITPMIQMIKKILMMEQNQVVVLNAVKISGLLAKKIRKNFFANAKLLFPLIIEKLKDKKTNMIEETKNTINLFFYCINIEDVTELLNKALNDKHAGFRVSLIQWTLHFLEKNHKNKEKLQVFKGFLSQIQKMVDDGTPSVREIAIELIGKLKAVLGSEFFENAFFEKFNPQKMNKIEEITNKFIKEINGEVQIDEKTDKKNKNPSIKQVSPEKSKLDPKDEQKLIQKDLKATPSKQIVQKIKEDHNQQFNQKEISEDVQSSKKESKKKKEKFLDEERYNRELSDKNQKLENFITLTREQCIEMLIEKNFNDQHLKMISEKPLKEKNVPLIELQRQQTEEQENEQQQKIQQIEDNMLLLLTFLKNVLNNFQDSAILLINREIFNILNGVNKIEAASFEIVFPFLLRLLGDMKYSQNINTFFEKIFENIHPQLVFQIMLSTNTSNMGPKQLADFSAILGKFIQMCGENYFVFEDIFEFGQKMIGNNNIQIKQAYQKFFRILYQHWGEQVKEKLQENELKLLQKEFEKVQVLSFEQKCELIKYNKDKYQSQEQQCQQQMDNYDQKPKESPKVKAELIQTNIDTPQKTIKVAQKTKETPRKSKELPAQNLEPLPKDQKSNKQESKFKKDKEQKENEVQKNQADKQQTEIKDGHNDSSESIKRVDISSEAVKIIRKLNDNNFQVRKQGMEQLEALLIAKKKIQIQGLNDLIGILIKKLNDPHKGLIKGFINLMALMINSIGKDIKSYTRTIILQLILHLNDKQQSIRNQVLTCFQNFGENLGFDFVINILAGCLQNENCEIKIEIFQWMNAQQTQQNFLQKVDPKVYVDHLLASLTHKQKKLRLVAEQFLKLVVAQMGEQIFVQSIRDLKPAIKQELKPIFEKCNADVSSLFTTNTQIPSNNALQLQRPPGNQSQNNSSETLTKKNLNRLSNHQINNYQNVEKDETLSQFLEETKSSNSFGKPQQKSQLLTCESNNLKILKERRVQLENKSPWILDALNQDVIDTIQDQLRFVVSEDFLANLFDFSRNESILSCIQSLRSQLPDENLFYISDLIFKWGYLTLWATQSIGFVDPLFEFYLELLENWKQDKANVLLDFELNLINQSMVIFLQLPEETLPKEEYFKLCQIISTLENFQQKEKISYFWTQVLQENQDIMRLRIAQIFKDAVVRFSLRDLSNLSEIREITRNPEILASFVKVFGIDLLIENGFEPSLFESFSMHSSQYLLQKKRQSLGCKIQSQKATLEHQKSLEPTKDLQDLLVDFQEPTEQKLYKILNLVNQAQLPQDIALFVDFFMVLNDFVISDQKNQITLLQQEKIVDLILDSISEILSMALDRLIRQQIPEQFILYCLNVVDKMLVLKQIVKFASYESLLKFSEKTIRILVEEDQLQQFQSQQENYSKYFNGILIRVLEISRSNAMFKALFELRHKYLKYSNSNEKNKKIFGIILKCIVKLSASLQQIQKKGSFDLKNFLESLSIEFDYCSEQIEDLTQKKFHIQRNQQQNESKQQYGIKIFKTVLYETAKSFKNDVLTMIQNSKSSGFQFNAYFVRQCNNLITTITNKNEYEKNSLRIQQHFQKNSEREMKPICRDLKDQIKRIIKNLKTQTNFQQDIEDLYKLCIKYSEQSFYELFVDENEYFNQYILICLNELNCKMNFPAIYEDLKENFQSKFTKPLEERSNQIITNENASLEEIRMQKLFARYKPLIKRKNQNSNQKDSLNYRSTNRESLSTYKIIVKDYNEDKCSQNNSKKVAQSQALIQQKLNNLLQNEQDYPNNEENEFLEGKDSQQQQNDNQQPTKDHNKDTESSQQQSNDNVDDKQDSKEIINQQTEVDEDRNSELSALEPIDEKNEQEENELDDIKRKKQNKNQKIVDQVEKLTIVHKKGAKVNQEKRRDNEQHVIRENEDECSQKQKLQEIVEKNNQSVQKINKKEVIHSNEESDEIL